jgi:hypothetical protein
MKTPKKIETYINMVQGIRYENENGGAYAYVQFLAYTRELLIMLRPFKKVERQMEAIEGISWLFNEHLAFTFTHRHKAIFDEKMSEVKKIFASIKDSLNESDRRIYRPNIHHAQAA